MTMIERVARAIAQHCGVDPSPEYAPKARAAIEAMREPTEAMIDVPLFNDPSAVFKIGGRTIDATKKYESRRDLRPYIYRAMIDAALKDQP